MFLRLARLIGIGGIACFSCACSVYDAGLVPVIPPANDASTAKDAGHADADMCVASVERCNMIDDDCDGQVDEAAAAQRDCESRVVHAQTTCQSGYCLRLACLTGYFNCDGRPENGCESNCPCGSSCSDGGSEDSGTDDGGREIR